MGDLRVELTKDGLPVARLQEREGGAVHDLVKTFTLAPSQLGGDTASYGTWGLRVTDLAAADVGTINNVTLTFQPVD